MSQPPDVSVTALRRLAQGLLYDHHGAEDVVQEAWLAALRANPPAARFGAWVTETVKRLARNRRREEARRQRREMSAARTEGQPAADDEVARIDVLRRMLDALQALEQPYRAALMLRFLEGLPTREVARRLGIPLNTARTHVRRGLERLRRDLDGERGQGRQGLLAALAPFVGPRPWRLALRDLGRATRTSSFSKEGPMLAMRFPVVLALSLAIVATAWLAWRPGEPSARSGLAPSPNAIVAGAPSSAAQQAPATTNSRTPAAPSPSAMNAGWIVRGRVLRASHVPYVGARIAGRVFAGTKHEGTPLLEEVVVADERGEFAWSIAPPSELVTVSVEPVDTGFTRSAQWDVFGPGDAPPERWELQVYPLDGVLRGTVSAPDESPIAGARVVYERFPEPREVSTDSAGRFELATSSVLGVDLRVLAAGFGLKRVELEKEAGERNCEIRLEPERHLQGRVLDESGAPLEGVRISATFPPELDGTTSDAAGHFELGGIGALDEHSNDLTVRLSKEGYPTTNHSVSRAELESGQALELRLAHGTTLSGRVVAPDGAPVLGAWVSLGFYSYPRNETYTDGDGRFEFRPLHRGLQRLWLWRAGFAQQRHDVWILTDTERMGGIEIVLGASHFLGGVVLDEAGEPVPQAFVFVEDLKPSDPHVDALSMHTDAEGRFRFEDLPDLPVELGVQELGHAPLRQPAGALDRDDIVLRLTGSAGIAGRVLDDASGTPLSFFTVRIARSSERLEHPVLPASGRLFSDATGEWRVDGNLSVDTRYWIEVTAPGYVAGIGQVVSTLAVDPDACVVRMRRGTRVRGRVVAHATQQPVAGALVELHSLRDQMGLELTPLTTRTDASGAFELADVPPGDATLHVLATEGDAVDGPFPVGSSEPTERWIELGGGARLSGRLLDASGNGLAGERVTLWGAEVVGDVRDWSAETGDDGSFELTELPSGVFQVQWERDFGGLKSKDLEQLVELKAGQERRLDLQPRGRATVRGTLTYPAGLLPEVVPVQLSPRHAAPSRWADGLRGGFAVRGRFEIRDLEAGTWVVMALPAGDGSVPMGSVQIEVPAEGELETAVVLEARR